MKCERCTVKIRQTKSARTAEWNNVIFLDILGTKTETVKLPMCNSYNTTSFEKANMFNQTSQDEALFHMHTFSPLITTFCHEDLVFFTCTVHFPRYITVQPEDRPEELQLQPACRSLCDDVYIKCKYAMDKINFHWPDQISCDKFRNDNCVSSGEYQAHLHRILYSKNTHTTYCHC